MKDPLQIYEKKSASTFNKEKDHINDAWEEFMIDLRIMMGCDGLWWVLVYNLVYERVYDDFMEFMMG